MPMCNRLRSSGTINDAAAIALAQFGELVVAATALSFGLELLLKALLLADGGEVPRSHRLHELFSKLPEVKRRAICAEFENVTLPPHTPVEVILSTSPDPPQNLPSSSSLVDLLVRASGTFNTWRYVYEYTQGEWLFFEFARLELLYRILRKRISVKHNLV
jgi:hypothetical protein